MSPTAFCGNVRMVDFWIFVILTTLQRVSQLTYPFLFRKSEQSLKKDVETSPFKVLNCFKVEIAVDGSIAVLFEILIVREQC